MIIDLLNEKLNLTDYTSTISSLCAIYQCIKPENLPYIQPKERVVFRRKTKLVEMYLVVDYLAIEKANESEALQLLINTFLAGIQTLLKRKDFNWEKFYNDVKSTVNPINS